MARRERLLILMVLSVSVAAGPTHADEAEATPLDAALAEVSALTDVGGDRVGYAGTESAFFAASRRLLEHGDEAAFRSLLLEESPVARAMGLYCLVGRVGVKAVPELVAALTDRQRCLQCPGGCMCSRRAVGTFAYDLLLNRHHLRCGMDPGPLAPLKERVGIGLRVLASDRAFDTHSSARRHLRGAVEAGRLKIDVETLTAMAPGLNRPALLKAVGRLHGLAGTRQLLRDVLRDDTEAVDARLAAASALTRSGAEEDLRALAGARVWLDALGPERLGTRFVETADALVAHDGRFGPIHAVRTWKGQDAIHDQIAKAVVADHAFALPDLLGLMGSHITGKKDISRLLVASLVRIAERCGAWSSPWDTWGNAPYALERLVVPVWGEDEKRRRPVGGPDAEARTRIAAAIGPHLE